MELRIITANLIEKRGKILLIQEGHKYAYKLWNFPAGKLKEEITLVENAIKEAKEETGCKVKVKGLVGIYQEIRKGVNLVFFVFASSIVSGNIRTKPDDEILQAKWFTYEEIKKMKGKLRAKFIWAAIEDYREKGFSDLKTINLGQN